MTQSDDLREKLARAHAEIQAIADEHVDVSKGMGQDIPFGELNALREAAQTLWDEEPQLGRDAFRTYQAAGISVEDMVRSVFSVGIVVGWRAAEK